ncbi:MAG TPA: tyrosine-type recombinase/integrase, partial [Flavobacteriales bacterium]|nr:tyrosine-type recombinase/integrase [Flavobacteriales bacterium]
MDWERALRGFRMYLKLQRSLSDRTIEAYMGDVTKLRVFTEQQSPSQPPTAVKLEDLQAFVSSEARKGIAATSQARLLSAVRMFFRSLRLDKAITDDPTELLESPRTGRKLPVFLTKEEVNSIVDSIDLSRKLAHRDKAMIETLYGCGLRVSELCGLRLSQLMRDDGFIRVVGKGNKERLVPIGLEALHWIELYLQHERVHLPVQANAGDHLFLNARGGGISRVAVLLLVKKQALKAHVKKTI